VSNASHPPTTDQQVKATTEEEEEMNAMTPDQTNTVLDAIAEDDRAMLTELAHSSETVILRQRLELALAAAARLGQHVGDADVVRLALGPLVAKERDLEADPSVAIREGLREPKHSKTVRYSTTTRKGASA
jgi:hypothetical protein